MKTTEEFAREVLDETLLCTRVWEAWQHNTMSDEDFLEARDAPEFLQQVMDLIDARVQEARDDEREKVAIELASLPYWQSKDRTSDGFDLGDPDTTTERTYILHAIRNKTEYSIHEYLQARRQEEAIWREHNPNKDGS